MTTKPATAAPKTPRTDDRLIGRLGPTGGPLLFVVAGIHGNEPAGIEAFGRVVRQLDASQLRGRLVGMRGNLSALAQGLRYLDVDLNRAWGPSRVRSIRDGDPAVAHQQETAEQREILQLLDDVFAEPASRIFALDLHTASSDGAPFATVGDTLRNRDFARGFPIPKVLGIEEQIDGALLEHLNNLGHTTMGFEAGRHDDPRSIDRHEALIWLALAQAGHLEPSQVPDIERQRAILQEASRGYPDFVEVRYRHAIAPGDGFKMVPGWTHFKPVARGELLGHDRNGEVKAREDGLVLLPLYQTHGDDGFFLGREFSPFWLSLSSWFRRMGLSGWIRVLPGVRREAASPQTLVVDRHVARFYAVEIFHLLGYRKRREVGSTVVFERRTE